MSKKFRTQTTITEGTASDRFKNPNPVLYGNIKDVTDNKKPPSPPSDTGGGGGSGGGGGQHPSLGYEVWATWWDFPASISPSMVYEHPGLVELLRFGPIKTVRQPQDVSGLPENEYQVYLDKCSRVPQGRRVLYDYYWQNPSYYKTYDDYYRTGLDGTTYTGNVSGFGDSSPLRFLTPWCVQSNADTKTSFKQFLAKCKTDNVLFDYFWDDTEGYFTFTLGGNYNAYSKTFDATNGLPNDYPTYESIPDPRRTPSIVSDSRFTTVLNQNGKTFSQEVVEKFRQLIGNPSDTRTYQQILSYFTSVNSRQNFKSPFGQTFDIRLAYYAFDSALYTYNFGTLRRESILNSLIEEGLSNVKVTQSDVAPLSVAEAKYSSDFNSHFIPRDYIEGYGSSLHFFGQNNLFYGYGYTNDPVTDDQKYAFVAGGSPFISPSHMAFVIELRKMRGLMRTKQDAYLNFVPVVTSPSNTFNSTRFHYDHRYWYEMMYHLCLHGANYFNVFTEIHNREEMQAVQTVLDEWKTISGNNKAIPASNATGNTNTIVERVNLEEAAEIGIMSGGYIPSINKWIWRLTAPPAISNYTLNDPSQTDLPQTISVAPGTKGVWIVRNVAGKPNYVPTVASYQAPAENNKRLFAENIFSNPNSDPSWGTWSHNTVSFFQGKRYPDGNRPYAWEPDPVNPQVSSPWHNIFYEHCIDTYNWGARAFSFYGPFGSEEDQPFWKLQQWKKTYTTYTGENRTCPAKWKGFKYAVRALLEGTMTPPGFAPMNEPCNVHFYMTSTRGVPKLYNQTNTYWQSLGTSNMQRDVNYYKELDEYIDDLIEAKARTPNGGKLYISVGSSVGTATPSSVHLYRNGDAYRTDAVEMADWYAMTRLRNNGIVYFYEARSPKNVDKPVNGQNNVVGPLSKHEWAGTPMCCGEYWLLFSDPEQTDPRFDFCNDYATNSETAMTMRLADSFYPLNSISDPYNTKLDYIYDGQVRLLVEQDSLTAQYTPSHHMFEFYKICDHYRKYNNLPGVHINTEQIMSYQHYRYMSSSNTLWHPVVNQPGIDIDMNYWKIIPQGTTVRYNFNPVLYLQNPATYGRSNALDGFWTDAGKNYWDTNIRRTTFNGFMQVVDNYCQSFCPPDKPDCGNPVYGSSTDVITRSVIDLGNW